MKKTAIFLIIVIALSGLSVFAWASFGVDQPKEELSYDTFWVEVLSGDVFAAKSSPQEIVLEQLETGDRISVGDILATAATGEAIVYTPDGSVLRLDPNARMQIQASRYEPQSGVLHFDTEVFIGRVWSKMTGMTAPDSLWRVQTPDGVATTTNAAFGIQAYATSTTAFTSEGVVYIRSNVSSSTTLSSGTAVRVAGQFTAEEREEGDAGSDLLSPSLNSATLAQLSDGDFGAWVSRERNRDEIINTMIDQLRGIGISNETELRQELSRYTHERFTQARQSHIDARERIIHLSDGVPQEVAEIFEDIKQIKETGEIENVPEDEAPLFAPDEAEVIMQDLLTDSGISETARGWLFEEYGDQIQNAFAGNLAYSEIRTLTRQYLEVVQNKTIIPPQQIAEEQETNIEQLSVTTIRNLSSPVPEGSAVEFTATATFADGSTRDVTQQAQWTVLGLIGTIQSPGVFNADLTSAQEGVAEASGSIVATFADESTGADVTGSTPIFRVVAQ